MQPDLGFKSSIERVKDEEVSRKDHTSRNIPFGVNYLDKCLYGILPDDLVLIGAATGVGKTELATTIALSSAESGRNVYFFALEAAQDEIERRLKYKILSTEYRKHCRFQPEETSYVGWYYGKHDELFAPYLDAVGKSPAWENLKTYYRTGDFGVEELTRTVMAIAEKAALIVIDHAHYLDLDGRDENRALTDATKKIRDLALINRVPIILLAHLRKRQSKDASPLPSLDDFHGSSNLVKIATKVIVLAPGEALESGRMATYIWVGKCRTNGSATRYIGKVVFNTALNQYEQNFDVGIRSPDGSRMIEIKGDKEIPTWRR